MGYRFSSSIVVRKDGSSREPKCELDMQLGAISVVCALTGMVCVLRQDSLVVLVPSC